MQATTTGIIVVTKENTEMNVKGLKKCSGLSNAALN